MSHLGFRSKGSTLRVKVHCEGLTLIMLSVEGSTFRVEGLGFYVNGKGLRFRAHGLQFSVQGLGLRVQ